MHTTPGVNADFLVRALRGLKPWIIEAQRHGNREAATALSRCHDVLLCAIRDLVREANTR